VTFVQSSRLWSALAFLGPFALYAFSISPNVGYWDTAEMQTVPWVLGIAHPTGFPVFVFAGWLFSHVVVVGSVAYRLGLMSAVAMAIAAWCAFAVVEELGEPPYLATGAALLFGAGNVAWSRGARAEVHAFAVLFAALAIWQALRFYRTGSRRALLWCALAFGLALGNHGIATLLFPGLVLLVLPRLRDVSFKTLGQAAALAAAPLLLYLWIPLRSAQLYAARSLHLSAYTAMMQIARAIAGSDDITPPSTPESADATERERAALHRLAWDATSSAFARSQFEFERAAHVDSSGMAKETLEALDLAPYIQRIKDFLTRP